MRNDDMDMADSGGFRHDLRAVMAESGYRRLLLVRLVSQLGDGILNVGLVSYVFFSPERAVTAGAAAVGFAILLLPYSFIGPFAGIILDTWPRRQVLLVTSLLRGAGTAVLAWLTAIGAAAPLLGLGALAVIGLNRFFLSGQGASLPHVVRPENLVMGNSVTPTLGSGVAAIGGVVGLVVSQLSGSDAAVLTAAMVCFLVSGLATLRLGRDQLGPDDDDVVQQARWVSEQSQHRQRAQQARTVVSELAGALHHLSQRRPAGLGLLIMAAHRFAWAFVIVMAILIYRNRLYDPGDPDAALAALGVAFAASAVGIGTAAIITPIATRRLGEERWITILLVATSVVLLLPVLRLSEPVMVLTAGLLGVAVQAAKICVDTLVQRWVDDIYRGRAFALYDMAFNVAMVVAAVVAAVVLPPDGWSVPALVTLAAAYTALALGYRSAWRRPTYLPRERDAS
jgi:MFS family permease